MAAVRSAEAGKRVQLFALGPAKRSHSACAQGGLNAAVNTMGEGDTTWEHFDDTIYGGDFLANQPPVKAMCEAAPAIVSLFDRMGCPFNRTAEGFIQVRRLGGAKYHRTVFTGATTGQQLLYSLDEQVRRWESEGMVERFEGWEFLQAVIDDRGKCCGIVAQDTRSMEIRAFSAMTVLIATGGPGMIFGRTTNSTINTGFAASVLFRQGAKYANGEFIQIHPTAIPGNDKNRLMSESARGEGGRVWVYRDGKPWYFLEEWYPAYGNLVPRDIATRAIFKVCVEMGLGIDGQNKVYLDLSHLDPQELNLKLGGILDIYEKFVGQDPKRVPMEIFPAVHYSMGGLWVDYNQMTSIPGLFAAGECEYQYHGANRLGGNGMLSAIFGGQVAADNIVKYLNGLENEGPKESDTLFTAAVQEQVEKMDALISSNGQENVYALHAELGEWMNNNVTVVRYNDRIERTINKIHELSERFRNLKLNNNTRWANQELSFARQMEGMLVLAEVIAIGAFRRNESRGAHFKPDFPERDDQNWLKTTIATHTASGPELNYESVDIQHIKPRVRKYDVAKEETMNVG